MPHEESSDLERRVTALEQRTANMDVALNNLAHVVDISTQGQNRILAGQNVTLDAIDKSITSQDKRNPGVAMRIERIEFAFVWFEYFAKALIGALAVALVSFIGRLIYLVAKGQ